MLHNMAKIGPTWSENTE